ncbi:MAG: DUF4136 domain-containing protein [Steroidobacteraceae bacterium]|nr:DUF4136 domain-containing protein [Steroidobacteraceae bacterium]
MPIPAPSTRSGLAAALATALLLLAGCAAPGPTVRAEYDRSADFRRYQTFGFFAPLGTDKEGYQTAVSTYLKAATRRELEARGYRYDEAAPQLLVNFGAKLNDKLRVSEVPVPTMGLGVGLGPGYYGYRAGLYGAWPLYPATETRVDQYKEGTLNVDLVDAGRKQLVWEGVAVGRVTQKTLENLQPALDSVVASVFAKFPVPAAAAATAAPKP